MKLRPEGPDKCAAGGADRRWLIKVLGASAALAGGAGLRHAQASGKDPNPPNAGPRIARRVKGLDYVEVMLPADKVAAATHTFGALLGCPFTKPVTYAKAGVISSASGAAGLRIVAPSGAESPLYSVLQQPKSTGGASALVWRIDSLDAMRRVVKERGINVSETVDRGDCRLIYLQTDQVLGYPMAFMECASAPFPHPVPETSSILKLNRIELVRPLAEFGRTVAFINDLFDVKMDLKDGSKHGTVGAISWGVGIEVVSPGSDNSPMSGVLEQKGPNGVIGPIVWTVADVSKMKETASALGHEIAFEFNDGELHQVTLSGKNLFGYFLTFIEFLKPKKV